MGILVSCLAALRRFGWWMIGRFISRIIWLTFLFVVCLVIGSLVMAYQFVDRSLNYVAVDAVARSVDHRCEASRRVKINDDQTQVETIPGNWTCDELHVMVDTNPDYRGFILSDELHVRVVYRSPVDKALYIGDLKLDRDGRTAVPAVDSPVRILASKSTAGQIQTYSTLRLDWFDSGATSL